MNYHNYNWIFVLSGGLNDDGSVYPWVARRLDMAFKYYIQKQCKIICLSGHTYHKPHILNDSGYVIYESTACAEYLIRKGVIPRDIYREWSSYDTIGNGFFSFMNYIVPRKIDRALVITSDFHMPRSRMIFNWMKDLFEVDIDLSFINVSDDGLDENIIAIRKEREEKSIDTLSKNITKINTLDKFHRWFYEVHKAYCSNVNSIRVPDITDKEIASY